LDTEKLIDKFAEKKARISKFKVWSIIVPWSFFQSRFFGQVIFVWLSVSFDVSQYIHYGSYMYLVNILIKIFPPKPQLNSLSLKASYGSVHNWCVPLEYNCLWGGGAFNIFTGGPQMWRYATECLNIFP
jgi:hypothetical protein